MFIRQRYTIKFLEYGIHDMKITFYLFLKKVDIQNLFETLICSAFVRIFAAEFFYFQIYTSVELIKINYGLYNIHT